MTDDASVCTCEWRGWIRAGADARCPIHGQPIALTPLQIRAALDETLSGVEAPSELVGQHVPSSARIWAEAHGIRVSETTFCPPNRLYLIAAVPVPDVFIP